LGVRLFSLVSPVVLAAALAGACTPKPDEGLRVLTQFPAVSADPQGTDDTWTQALLANVYDPLVSFDAEGRLQPALAVAWSNPDDHTWRFELRRDVTFHDGWRFTAEDVAWTLKRGLADPESWVRSVAPLLEEVSVRGPHTVDLRTREPSALLLNQLAAILVLAHGHAGDRPVGTGPYRVARFEAQEVELAAYDAHWRGRPRWRRALFRCEPDAVARTTAVREGRADLAEVPRLQDLDALARDPVVRIIGNQVPRVAVLGLAVTPGSPFADARVRAAIADRIDRDALARALDGGRSRPATQLAPPGIFGTPPEPAARTIAAAGAPAATAPLYFSGERNGALARLVAAQAAAAGVTLSPRELPAGELDRLLVAAAAPAFVVNLTFPNRDASDFLTWGFHTRSADGRWGAGNFTGHADAETDALIEAAEREFDSRARAAKLVSAMRAAAAANAWIPLLVPPGLHVAHRQLRWERSATGRVRLEEISRVEG
jgi:peptide/nickel transport system substrate-binding protein